MTLVQKVQDLAGKLGVKIEQNPNASSLYRAVPTIEEDLGDAGNWQNLEDLYEALVSRAGEIPGAGPDARTSRFDKPTS